jgi:hypothetical protein
MRHSAAIATLAFSLVPGATIVSQTPAPAQSTGAEFSGQFFGSFNVRTDSLSRASFGGKARTAFSIDRAYITLKAPAGDNGAFRFTTDIYQDTLVPANAYYAGWAVRLKYAWFQYTMLRNHFGPGSSLIGRIGSVHNLVIDQSESPFPRFIAPIAVERVPYFASADVGAAALLTLANRKGEVYATLTNGPGYTTYDKDRFKDIGVRVTLTPWGNQDTPGIRKTAYVMPWYYKGFVGSRFQSGGAGQVGPGTDGAITGALPRDRYGLVVGVRDRRLTAAAEVAWAKDGSESGSNTAAAPRVETDTTGRMIDAYLLVRPMEWLRPDRKSPWTLIGRWDRNTPNASPTSANYAGTTPAYDYFNVGSSYELNQRFTFALDYQLDRPVGFPPATGSNVEAKPRVPVFFLHWNATF